METSLSTSRKIIGWVIAGMLTALYAYSSSGKILHPQMMDHVGLANWRVLIAIGEIGSALLYLFPHTNLIGTLLLSSYMGGAILLSMTNNWSILVPSIVLIIIWAGAFVRHPDWVKL
jgi:hypothetical protein